MSATNPSLTQTVQDEQKTAESSKKTETRSLFNPLIDFWLLGGLSLVVVPIIVLLPESLTAWVIGASFFIAHFVNHPHFAHSYQIFYRSFRGQVVNASVPLSLRLRYWFSGVIVPIILAAYLVTGYHTENLRMLGLLGNLMGFLVGWHYVKQGYGMLIVQSVLKRSYFDDHEKKWLLLNAYACWIASYLLLNYKFSGSELWGVEYWAIPVEFEFVAISIMAAVFTTINTLRCVIGKFLRSSLVVPVAGLFAYGVTLYIWIFAALHPVVIFIVPALHSLQYLAVVWRFESNYQTGNPMPRGRWTNSFFGDTSVKRLWRFIVVGIGLGYLGFWMIPEWISQNVQTEITFNTPGIFLFMFWIFINVHHYFLDNVMWRKENPETGKYLFSPS